MAVRTATGFTVYRCPCCSQVTLEFVDANDDPVLSIPLGDAIAKQIGDMLLAQVASPVVDTIGDCQNERPI